VSADTDPASDIFDGWIMSSMDAAGSVIGHCPSPLPR
jgi:acyl-CoA hydrolase